MFTLTSKLWAMVQVMAKIVDNFEFEGGIDQKWVKILYLKCSCM